MSKVGEMSLYSAGNKRLVMIKDKKQILRNFLPGAHSYLLCHRTGVCLSVVIKNRCVVIYCDI